MKCVQLNNDEHEHILVGNRRYSYRNVYFSWHVEVNRLVDLFQESFLCLIYNINARLDREVKWLIKVSVCVRDSVVWIKFLSV